MPESSAYKETKAPVSHGGNQKKFSGVLALKGVDLNALSREVHVIMENGGKIDS